MDSAALFDSDTRPRLSFATRMGPLVCRREVVAAAADTVGPPAPFGGLGHHHRVPTSPRRPPPAPGGGHRPIQLPILVPFGQRIMGIQVVRTRRPLVLVTPDIDATVDVGTRVLALREQTFDDGRRALRFGTSNIKICGDDGIAPRAGCPRYLLSRWAYAATELGDSMAARAHMGQGRGGCGCQQRSTPGLSSTTSGCGAAGDPFGVRPRNAPQTRALMASTAADAPGGRHASLSQS
jgi:hypothetical protein